MKWDKDNPFLIFRKKPEGENNYAVFEANATAMSYDGGIPYEADRTVAATLPAYSDGMELLYDYSESGHSWNKDKLYACRFEHVPLDLTFMGFSRGRSAVTLYWLDEETDTMYPMFMKDFSAILTENYAANPMHGHFTAVKRGANYGIAMDEVSG